MNVCIVTVYNSENCGSFLQAFALSEQIKALGHNVYFLKRDASKTSHALLPHIIDGVKKAIKLDFFGAGQIIKRYFTFKKAQSVFSVIEEGSAQFNDIDCFIIGSDTVWNLKNPYFLNNTDTYFGINLKGKRVITYAVSVANTEMDLFLNNEKIISAINSFSAISVRDTYTEEVVKNASGRDSQLVCDPTFLLDKEYYNEFTQRDISYSDGPILIYYFGRLSKEAEKNIKHLSKKTGKKIISFGEYRGWCDINLPFDPYHFIQCFKDCSFVITNTYHGTIFSLIFQKQFADYATDKKKVEHLLTSLNAQQAFANDNDELMPYYEDRLDYSKINDEIEKIKASSIEYLKRNLI